MMKKEIFGMEHISFESLYSCRQIFERNPEICFNDSKTNS